MESKTSVEEKPWLKMYPEGVPATLDIPEKSLPDALDESAEKWGNQTALIFYGRKITYRELKEQVDRFATALHDLGVKKGDRVAFLLLNSPQFIISYFAVLKIGAMVTPISPVYVSQEIKHQLENSEANFLICQDILYEGIEKTGVNFDAVVLTNIAQYLPKLQKFMGKSILRSVYRKMELPPVEIFEREGFYQFQELIKKYPPNPPKIDINPREDLAILPYSGGTTGLPKGVMITHFNLLANLLQYRAFLPFLEDGKEVGLLYMPFYHIAGMITFTTSLVCGWVGIIMTTPDFDEILNNVGTYKVTMFFGAPSLFETLKDFDKTDRVDWKRLKIVSCGADTLYGSTGEAWEKRTGVSLHDTYGLTESSATTHMTPRGKRRIGSFGVPVPNTEARIAHTQTNEFLPSGEIGEVLVTSPSLMKGYWKNPEETKQTLVEINGKTWLRTGDLATMDEEGYFYFYDRKKDMVVYKGYNVFAREVEEALTSHPKVRDAGVIGIPDPKVGQHIKAYVVLEREARGKLSEEEIIKYCETKLAHYKVPRTIEFRGEIPTTDIGKVSRRELREEEV